jgi:hypothetical protein
MRKTPYETAPESRIRKENCDSRSVLSNLLNLNVLKFRKFYVLENELYVDSKLNNYLKITGITCNVFRPKKTLNKTRIKLDNTH